MWDNLWKIAGTVASTLFSGGNPLVGVAVKKISSILLDREDATPEEIDKAMEQASPEQLEKVKEVEKKFKGIKETTEVIQAMSLLAVFLTKRLKDGLGMDDAMSLIGKMQSDPEFSDILAKATQGINNVPQELQDLDFEEMISLSSLGVDFIKDMVKALKKT